MEREMENLSLKENEDVELIVDPKDLNNVDIDYELYLVGKVIGERMINFPAMERMLLSLWRSIGGSRKPIGNGLHLMQFFHVVDVGKEYF
ncbi:hypothetical protein PVK06_029201 [Gossypium arboreum]|uniref:Uncharacterized protein n=1 Tax=Gossypium arboreum TaxID=29729 RepID=A0ABR0P5Y8_GOSAR|nr:hypothetical protein PVK06_029201 [Gossypium arboreum]